MSGMLPAAITRRRVLEHAAKGAVIAGIGSLAGCFKSTSPNQAVVQNPTQTSFDVVVYGGTPSGMMAVLAAVRGGASVAIVEPTMHLGGILTSGLGQTDTSYKQYLGGLTGKFYLDVGKAYGFGGSTPSYVFEPHVAEAVFNGYMKSAKAGVFLGRYLTAIDQSNGRIVSITLDNGTVITADQWIDVSYEGDLMAAAGATYVVGRESMATYGEMHAGAGYKPELFSVNPYLADGSLIPGINPDPKEEAGAGDSKIMAYTFRCCTTTNKANMAPFPMPSGYTPARFEGLARWIANSGFTDLSQIVTMQSTIKQKYDLLWVISPFSVSYVGGAWLYPDADWSDRQKIWQDHYNYVAGWLYYVANDPSVPSTIQAELNTYGLPLDEFTDNNNWPWQMYVREGRRLVGQYVMTEADITTNIAKTDSVALGTWYGDCHYCDVYARRISEHGTATPTVFADGELAILNSAYQIPFRSILPNPAQAPNLAVTCCLSASHVGFSSLRGEPTFMMLGEAAGTAAALAVKNSTDISAVNVTSLQNTLIAGGSVLAT